MQGHRSSRKQDRSRQFPPTFLPSVAQAADQAMTDVLLEDAGWIKDANVSIEVARGWL